MKVNLIKKVSLLFALVATVMLVGCGGDGGEGGFSLEGTWTLSSLDDGTEEYTVEEFAEMAGIDASILTIDYTFEADGVLKYVAAGVEGEGTYELDGTKVTMTIVGQTTESEYDAEREALVTTDAATGSTSYITKK